MGTAHLQPHDTRQRHNKIIDYKRQHISTTKIPEERWEAEECENLVARRMCEEYRFTKIRDGGEWINNGTGVDEKVVAETKHGVELRLKYHPSGSTYYFLVVTSGEFNQENLAIQHLQNYNETLREILEGVYGEVRRKTGRWTSEAIST